MYVLLLWMLWIRVKKERGSEVEHNSKSVRPCSFLDACHVGEPMMALTATWGITKSTTLCVLEISICSAWYNSIRQSNGITTTNKSKLWLTCNDKLFNKFVIFFLWRMTDAEVLKQTCIRLVRWRGFSCLFW